jgi:hypothetical protein
MEPELRQVPFHIQWTSIYGMIVLVISHFLFALNNFGETYYPRLPSNLLISMRFSNLSFFVFIE